MFTVAFFLSMVSEVNVRKNSEQTLPQVEKVTVQILVIGFWTLTSNHKINKYWASTNLLFLIKSIIWDCSTKKVCISGQSMFFYTVIVENIPTSFFINQQKTKTSLKLNIAARAICSNIVMSLQTGFCPLLNVYFNDMEINMWLHLSSSLWEIPLCCDLFRKRIDQKSFLHRNK